MLHMYFFRISLMSFTVRYLLKPESESTTPICSLSSGFISLTFFPKSEYLLHLCKSIQALPLKLCFFQIHSDLQTSDHPSFTSMEQLRVKFLYCFFNLSIFNIPYPSNINSNKVLISSSLMPKRLPFRIACSKSCSTSFFCSSIINSVFAAVT